jgi:hypothetical protein
VETLSHNLSVKLEREKRKGEEGREREIERVRGMDGWK